MDDNDWRAALPDKRGFWALSYCEGDGSWSAPDVLQVVDTGGHSVRVQAFNGESEWFSDADPIAGRRRWKLIAPSIDVPTEELGPIPPPPPVVDYEAVYRRTTVKETVVVVRATNEEDAKLEALKTANRRFESAWDTKSSTQELVSIKKKGMT